MTVSFFWPTEFVYVTQKFGVDPNYYRQFGLAGHEGLDIRAPVGSSIFACEAGTVYETYHSGAYGLQVRLLHNISGRIIKTVYGHMKEVVVSKGDRVARGQRLGYADTTGNARGSHLHLTVKVDGAKILGYPEGIVDPTKFFRELD